MNNPLERIMFMWDLRVVTGIFKKNILTHDFLKLSCNHSNYFNFVCVQSFCSVLT